MSQRTPEVTELGRSRGVEEQAGDTWISGSGFQKREQMPGDHAACCRTSLGHVERVIRNAPAVTTLHGHRDHCPHEETQARKEKSGLGSRAVEPQSRDQRNPCVCKVQLGGGGRVSLVEAALAPQHHMTAIWLQARHSGPTRCGPRPELEPKAGPAPPIQHFLPFPQL